MMSSQIAKNGKKIC